MQCLSCGHNTTDTDNYCPACGAQLKRSTGKVCQSCGRPILGDAERCELCDTRAQQIDQKYRQFRELSVPMPAYHRLGPKEYVQGIVSESTRPVSERRVITTLFADVVGSTSLAEKLDPEDVTRIINSAFKGMVWPVKKYEGTLARLMGDGILAIFGAPVAHENNSARACNAALEMLENISELSERIAQTFPVDGIKIRVGISSGLAVVGEVGTPERSEYTAIGDSVNLAARLQSIAKPGSIAISGSVKSELDNLFETGSLGKHSIRGKSERVEVYDLIGLASSHNNEVAHFKKNLVGREHELQVARDWITGLTKGRTGMLVITAPDGMGKSHFLHTLKQSLPDDTRWSLSQALSYSKKLIYSTIREHALNLLGASVDTPANEIRRRLVETVPEIEKALLAPLTYVLRGQLSEREQAMIRQNDPEMMTQLVHDALVSLFHTLAAKTPIVLACDDAHWIDRQSSLVLKRLVNSPNKSRICVLPTAPSDSGLVDLTDGVADHSLMTLSLERLPDHLACELVRDEVRSAGIDEGMIVSLVRQADGNPFYLNELLSSLLVNSKRAELPQSIQAAILARLDRLPPRHKRSLQAASVINATFNAAILKEVLKENSELSAIEVILSELVAADFLVREKLSADLNLTDYRFKNELATNAIYTTLLRSDSRKLHRRTALALEQLPDELTLERAADIAYHYEMAGNHEMAAEYYYQSAELALALFEFEQAKTNLKAAINLIPPDEIDLTIPNIAYRSRLTLAQICASQGDRKGAIILLNEAVRLIELPSAQAAALRHLGRVYLDDNEIERARETLERALDNMKGAFDECEAGLVYLVLSPVYFELDKLDTALELAELALVMNQNCGNRIGEAHAHNNRGAIMSARGEVLKAREEFDKAETICQELEDGQGNAAVLNNRGLLFERENLFPSAIEQLEEAVRNNRSCGYKQEEVRALCNLRRIYHEVGKVGKVDELSIQIEKILAQIGLTAEQVEPVAWLSGGYRPI